MCDTRSLPWRKPYRCRCARIPHSLIAKHRPNRLSQHHDPPIDLSTMPQQLTQLMLRNPSNNRQVRFFRRWFDDLHPSFSTPQGSGNSVSSFTSICRAKVVPSGCVCVVVIIPNCAFKQVARKFVF
jgi:hypothetical protein